MRARHLLLLTILHLALDGPVPGQDRCGDCTLDGVITVLDALLVANIQVGLVAPGPAQTCTCDADGGGAVNILDALLVAQRAIGLPSLLHCGPGCPEPYRVLTCGQVDAANPGITVSDPGGVPDFAIAGSTVFYAIAGIPPESSLELSLEGMAIGTDLDLYVGRPMLIPGSEDAGQYTAVQALRSSDPEVLVLDCATVALYGGYAIPVAVHAYQAGSSFDLRSTCIPSPCPQTHTVVGCGSSESGTFTDVQCPAPPPWCPTDLAAGESTVAFFAIPPVAPVTERIEITLSFPAVASPAPDLDLYLGDPGTAPADTDPGSYSRFSTSFHPEVLIIDAASSPPISAYHGQPVAVAVVSYVGVPPLDYQLEVSCTAAAGVTMVGCGYHQDAVSGITTGSLPGPADLTLPGTTRFFGISGVPAGTREVTILVDGMPPGTDLDLFVGRASTVPGDTDVQAYPYYSRQAGSTPELVVVDCAALYQFQPGQPTAPALALAVHGRAPGLFDLQVSCGAAPCSACITELTWSWSGGCLGTGGAVGDREDRYTFPAAAGQQVQVEVDTYEPTATFDPAVALYRPLTPTPSHTASGGGSCTASPVAGACPLLVTQAVATGVHQVGVKSEGPLGPAGMGLYVVRVLVDGAPVPLALEADDAAPLW